MLIFIILATPTMYCLSAGIQYTRSNKAQTPSRLHKQLPKVLAITAAILHTFILQNALHHENGINLNILTSGSLISWLVVLVLLISSFRQKIDNLFIAVFPMAALLIVLGALVSTATPKPYASGVVSHILLSILAYSIFTLAAFQAILLHKQSHALKHNISGSLLGSLPPLQTMEKLLFEMLWTGFILLSAALITGLLFVDNMVEQHLVHKSFLSGVSWIIFAILLTGRTFWGWRGHKAIRWTLGGFTSLMLGFFGSKLVFEVFMASNT